MPSPSEPSPGQLAALAGGLSGTPEERVTFARKLWKESHEQPLREAREETERAAMLAEFTALPSGVRPPTRYPVKLADLLPLCGGRTEADRTKRLRDYLRHLARQSRLPEPPMFDDDPEAARRHEVASRKALAQLDTEAVRKLIEEEAERLMKSLRADGLKHASAWAQFVRGFTAWWEAGWREHQVAAGRQRAKQAASRIEAKSRRLPSRSRKR